MRSKRTLNEFILVDQVMGLISRNQSLNPILMQPLYSSGKRPITWSRDTTQRPSENRPNTDTQNIQAQVNQGNTSWKKQWTTNKIWKLSYGNIELLVTKNSKEIGSLFSSEMVKRRQCFHLKSNRNIIKWKCKALGPQTLGVFIIVPCSFKTWRHSVKLPQPC